MRRLISRRPSPAMAIAFVALLAALSGTAVALPGTNTVNSGDIVNNTIRSKDVRNNNLRGKDVRNSSLAGRDVKNGSLAGRDVKNGSLTGSDVRNDSLTGADINESTLGTVPNANHANSADSAGTAGTAGVAASVRGLSSSGQAFADEGQRVTILSFGPWAFVLDCGVASAGASQVMIRNVSAGDDSHMDDNLDGDEDNDFDQGEEFELSFESGPDSVENSAFSALGSGGSAIHGQSIAGRTPSYSTRDCVGAVGVQGNL